MASKEAHAPHEGVPLKYDESGNSFEEERGLYHHAKHPARRPWLLYISLAISILANIALLLFVLNPNALSRPPQERTRYGKISRAGDTGVDSPSSQPVSRATCPRSSNPTPRLASEARPRPSGASCGKASTPRPARSASTTKKRGPWVSQSRAHFSGMRAGVSIL